MIRSRLYLQVLLLSLLNLSRSYSVHSSLNRRRLLESAAGAAFYNILPKQAAWAFDGTGSSISNAPSSKAELAKGYRQRIVADVRDFNALGKAILDRNEMDGNAWLDVFIPYPRREADALGRTYAAQIDLIGPFDSKTGGGAAYLLASTFAKPNKPTENLPQMKKYKELFKSIEGVDAAGRKKDLAKAKKEFAKASAVLSDYLQEVGMPASLSDPLYQ